MSRNRLSIFAVILTIVFFRFNVAAQTTNPSKLEASLVLSRITVPQFGTNSSRLGAGGRIGYLLTRPVRIEGELDVFPVLRKDLETSGAMDGFWGVLMGGRKGRFDLLGKMRPGFLSYRHRGDRGNVTRLVFDLGGAVEWTFHSGLAARFDVSDLMIHNLDGFGDVYQNNCCQLLLGIRLKKFW
jgi:hypothetical protein